MAEKINILTVFNTCRTITKQAEDYAAKNNGKIDPAIVTPLGESFEKIIEFVKMNLIMSHDAFYGCVFMSLDTKIDFTVRSAVDIDVKTEPFTMLFNPLFCSQYKYSEFVSVVIKEILKLVYDHPSTFGKLNSGNDDTYHDFLEKGSDASVSSLVQEDIRLDSRGEQKLRLPEDSFTPSTISKDIGKKVKDRESLDYYFKVLKAFSKPTPPPGDPNAPPGDNTSSPGSGQLSQNAAENIASRNNNQGTKAHQWESSNADDVKERTKNFIREIYNNMSEKDRGITPASIIEQIQKLLKKPEINWKQLLKKLIGTIPVPYRKTKTRLNRRQPFRADLSGKLPKRIVDVVCVIDTSGSMSERDIAYCMNEVFHIVKDHESKITIIECDAEVGKVYQAKKPSEVCPKVTGRGGTCFTPAIEFINGTTKDSRWKNHPQCGKFRQSLMIYFTDGGGESEIPKPLTFRNMWVVIDQGNGWGRNEDGTPYLSVKNPYGEVKSLRGDADWQKYNNSF